MRAHLNRLYENQWITTFWTQNIPILLNKWPAWHGEMPHQDQPGMQQQDLTLFAAVVTGFPSHCFHSNRGLIVLRSNCSYVLEPLPDNPDLHQIYRLDDLRMPAGACGHQGSMATARNWLGDFAAGVKSPNHRVRRASSISQLTAVTQSHLEDPVWWGGVNGWWKIACKYVL